MPLLLAPDGRRLSKRDGDLDMGALRRRFSPEELLGKLSVLMGLRDRPDSVTARELAGEFRWTAVPREDIVVQPEVFG